MFPTKAQTDISRFWRIILSDNRFQPKSVGGKDTGTRDNVNVDLENKWVLNGPGTLVKDKNLGGSVTLF